LEVEMSEAGTERRGRAQGVKSPKFTDAMLDLDPQLVELTDGFVFDDIWGRDGISFEERMLVAITALAATEHPNQLRIYLHGALQDGVPARKIHEALLMMLVYVGFPTALTALVTWKEVVGQARRQGMVVDLPGDPNPG